MTTPAERTTALMQARDFLLALSTVKKLDAAALRSRAQSLLRHYPDPGMIGLIADSTEWLEGKQDEPERPAPLVKNVELPPLPSSVTDDTRLNGNFFENFRQRELESLRARIRTGDLLPAEEFRRRLRASSEALRQLVVEGSVFAIDVDGLCYFPSLLVDERYDREKLFSICRIIWPAHPTVRLHFLTSRRGNLGGLTPLECLADNKRYRVLRGAAWAESVDSYRTSVSAYAGLHDTEPSDVSPSYSVAADVDPRLGFWKRGLRTLKDHGFTGVFPPYEQLREATIFISQIRGGSTTPDEGAKLGFSIDGSYASVNVERFVSKESQYLRVPLTGTETIEDSMRAIFRELWNRGAR
ncbi:BPSL0761 family protein [Paraburkholderia fungorum]|uniref:BPSL0761 family protein n=1 Tax=Paraburkholderia fungorum TaxID=134537 RepID=UPI0011B273D6|nr:BPSL0761 family protein [Paraburkholderia fungorum]